MDLDYVDIAGSTNYHHTGVVGEIPTMKIEVHIFKMLDFGQTL